MPSAARWLGIGQLRSAAGVGGGGDHVTPVVEVGQIHIGERRWIDPVVLLLVLATGDGDLGLAEQRDDRIVVIAQERKRRSDDGSCGEDGNAWTHALPLPCTRRLGQVTTTRPGYEPRQLPSSPLSSQNTGPPSTQPQHSRSSWHDTVEQVPGCW